VSGPLEGISVLAAEQMHALPHATQLLALLGADVIKVEPPRGDTARHSRPMARDRDGGETGSTFVRNNLGKSSVTIDLKQDAGRELFLRLATTVDAVAENMRPGTVDRLGIGYDAVRAVNPAAVYVSLSGFGNATDPASPYREWAAYAPIVEGMAGLYEYSRTDEEAPRPALAGALGDTGPGLYAVIGLLAKLHERTRTGTGGRVDISMYDSMIAIADIIHPASMGTAPNRALDGIGILHAFRAKNGWFTVEVVREQHFPRFARAIGRDDWLDDERLRVRSGWSEHMDDVIRPGVERWAADRSKSEAARILAEHGVAAGPVNSAADIEADRHVTTRPLIHHIDTGDPGGADHRVVSVVGNPISFGTAPPPAPRRWPLVGEDTERVLTQRLALEPAELASLRAQGVIA
jgi:formyl-CoA transferase